jgi:hypothetical protein
MIILFSVFFIGQAYGLAEISLSTRHIYHVDQDVQGNGFFNSYVKTDVPNLSLSNMAHGSGNIDHESKIDSRNGAKYDETNDEYSLVTDRGTTLIESLDFAYAPISMQMGQYSRPISFQSKGSEETRVKNYYSGISMNARFNYADTLSKNLSGELYWKLVDNLDTSDVSVSNLDVESKTKLNFEAAFSGNGHVSAVDSKKVSQETELLIDEDYRGTYYITKNVSHNEVITLKRSTDDWLPCCSGGFSDMNILDKKPFKSATGIFDCNCYIAPTSAEFPRVY